MARPKRSVATDQNAIGNNQGAAEGAASASSAASEISTPSEEVGAPVILPLESEDRASQAPNLTLNATPQDNAVVPHARETSIVKPVARSTPSLTGTLSAAGGSGAALLAVANGLKEPYKTWVPYFVPTLSAYIAWGWPLFENWSKDRLLKYLRERKKKQAVKVMMKEVAKQQLLLQDDSLSDASRAIFKKNIETLQQAIAVKAFESIEYHLDA